VGVAVPLKANATAWFYVATFVTQVELIQSKRLRKRFDEHFHLFSLKRRRASAQFSFSEGHHRPAPALWCCQPRAWTFGMARAEPAPKQPGREFASADLQTRAQFAAVQVAGIGAAHGGKPHRLARHQLLVAALATTPIAPLAIIGIFLERSIVKGLTAGSVEC